MKLELSSIIWFFVALVAAVVAVRATFRFDLNEWLRDRRERNKERAKALCPHVRLTTIDGEPAVQSTFMSPPGTVAWQCQQCGAITYDQAAIDESAYYWRKHPLELMERLKKIDKLNKL